MPQVKEQITYPKRMEGGNMSYEFIKNELAARRQRKVRQKTLDATPLSKEQIDMILQKLNKISSLIDKVAKEKGTQFDDGMQALDEELAKYGYSQEKPKLSFADQEREHTVPAREMAGDSSYDRYVALGKEIARKYNPHYKM